MIEFTDKDLFNQNRKSTKGDQFKFIKDNIWYKADNNGYEALSEYLCSNLLKKSSIHFPFVNYELDMISYKSQTYNACKSNNFLNERDMLITIEKLHEAFTGIPMSDKLTEFSTYSQKAKYLVESVISLTNLTDFGSYMYEMMLSDALFLNEDRHLNNIAVIQKEDGTFDYCPFFDFGASLISDTSVDYSLSANTLDLIKQVGSKTIGYNFNDTIDAFSKYYETSLQFDYDDKYIDILLSNVSIYDDLILKRVKQVLLYQKNKMLFYFK